MSSRQKGWKNRRKCIVWLQDNGFIADTVEKTGKFATQKDMFGLWDIVAMNETRMKFIQVTSNRHHTHKPYRDFSKHYRLPNLSLEQWVWIDRKGWRIFEYFGGAIFEKEFITVKQLREGEVSEEQEEGTNSISQ